ncbi:MAG TPA: hypothetical protein VGV87_17905 [Blastocatellia bacterium]|jgi:hypothetical protein|nr:hypothetical protein [Blastocatellia bacterium]
MKCPAFARLIDYLDGHLAVGDASLVAQHLEAGCSSCTATRQWYERTVSIAAADDSFDPPPWVLKRALRIHEVQREKPGILERMGRAVASLVFDSIALPVVEGVRSTESANRQLLYRVRGYSIDLQIAPADQSHADVAGQVLREGEASFDSVAARPVDLMRGDERLLTTATNAVGEFTIKGVELGDYGLQLELPDGVLVVEEFPVTAPL